MDELLMHCAAFAFLFVWISVNRSEWVGIDKDVLPSFDGIKRHTYVSETCSLCRATAGITVLSDPPSQWPGVTKI